MRRAVLLLSLMLSTALAVSAQAPLQTLNAHAAQARNNFVTLLPNPDGAWNFTSVSVTAAVPAVGSGLCGVNVYIVDWNAGTFSQATFLGAGGQSSNQSIVFSVPKGNSVSIWVFTSGTCTSPAKEINIAAQYTVSP